jgi:hypothetical protein
MRIQFSIGKTTFQASSPHKFSSDFKTEAAQQMKDLKDQFEMGSDTQAGLPRKKRKRFAVSRHSIANSPRCPQSHLVSSPFCMSPMQLEDKISLRLPQHQYMHGEPHDARLLLGFANAVQREIGRQDWMVKM